MECRQGIVVSTWQTGRDVEKDGRASGVGASMAIGKCAFRAIHFRRPCCHRRDAFRPEALRPRFSTDLPLSSAFTGSRIRVFISDGKLKIVTFAPDPTGVFHIDACFAVTAM
jgi:hypothetical protein